MGDCPTADALGDLAAGALPPDTTAELHRHVRGCEACGAALAAMAEPADPADPDDAPALAAGQRVGRFELVQFLGSGSMGAVWSARDTELGRTVALKTLRPLGDAATDRSGLKRLLREAQAMARLSHPNVVTVHEVVTRGEQIFLAMELVGGGTLREWLEKPRRLDELLAVFVHAGHGLAAAHAAGLVHRDFKPDNVLVGDDGRVRVTDFGLARPAGAARPAASSPDPLPAMDLTRSGALVGTPAYMAPEQMRGEPIDARADVFGFCTTLYEALYGIRPFAGDSLEQLRQRAEANEVRPPPAGRAAPGWLHQALLKGLRAAPAERWPSMDELLSAIEAGRARAQRPWRATALLAGALVAATVAGVLVLAQRKSAPAPASARRRSVAVLGPRNQSGRPEIAWLSAALGGMLGSELAASPELRLIPERNVAHARGDLQLPPELDTGALRRLSNALGADLILEGSFVAPAADTLRLDLRLHDARSGELAASVSESGDKGRLLELAAQAGDRLRAELRVPQPARPGAASASYPRDPEAERLDAEGLDALQRYDPGAAVKSLSRAAELAPDNARILGALAEAHAELGDVIGARAAGKRAFAAASGLDREERLRIERIMESPSGSDWRRAVEISQALWTFFPDDVEYGLKLESDLTSARRIEDAYAVNGQLRRLPLPESADPRIDAAEAQTALQARDLQRALAAARKAADGGRKLNSRQTLAKGRFIEGTTLFDLGDPVNAAPALAEAESVFREIGDRDEQASTLRILGWLDQEAGNLTAARTRFDSGLALARATGDLYLDAALENDLGNVLSRMRQPAQALEHYDVARAGFQKLNRTLAAVMVTYNRGDVFADLGNLESAASEYETALKAERDIEGKPYLSHTTDLLAWVVWQRDELQRAHSLCDEASATAGEELFQIGDARLCSARVELALGRPDKSLEQSTKAAELFGGVKHIDGLARAQALQALALLALGRSSEGAEAAAAARKSLALTQNVRPRAVVGVASARVLASQPGQVPAAIAAMREVVAEAARTGSTADQLEARLALAELLARAGDPEGRAALLELARDAQSKGFARIAHAAQRVRPR